MKKSGLTTGEAARGLGIDSKTVANWMKHPKLRPFFSKIALGEDGSLVRTITDEDFRVLNTIRELTAGLPNNAKDWDLVADRLDEGYRTDNFPPQAAMVRASFVPLVQAVRQAGTEARADNAELQVQELRRELDKLQTRIADLTQQNLQITQTYLREIAELNRQIGLLTGRLEHYEKRDNKPE